MSLKTLQSKDYQKLLNDVTKNIINTIPDSSNQDLWILMGEALEMSNTPKDQISTIMRKDIEQILYDKIYYKFGPREDYKWHNNTYWNVTREHGWINSDMARHLDPNRIKEIVPCNNPEMKVILYDIINLCRILIDKSKKGIPLEETFGNKEMKELYKQQHTIINNCKNAIDNKTKVPRNTEIFLLDCLGTILGSVNKCAETFMEQNLIRLKKQLTISVRTGKPVPFFTLKQATKFQNGMRQSQLNILKPTSRDSALFLDYTGIQCKCGSYRVRQKQASYKLECYDCDSVMPPTHISKCTNSTCRIPLYKERLLHIVKTGRCENCNEIVDLPQELINYAKS